MKLYIRQKVFSWRDKFAVKGENGDERYFAQGEMLSIRRKLHVYDAAGREVAFIRAKLLSFMPRYFIESGGRTYTLVKEFTLLKPRFHIIGLPWKLSGDFFAHEYRVSDKGAVVMEMSKKWFSWGDSYELSIQNPQDELLCLCVALAIDCVNAGASGAAASS